MPLLEGLPWLFTISPVTRDIDLLIDSEDYEKTKGILEREEYFKSASPWTFKRVPMELHRFLKGTTDDEMLIDILIVLFKQAAVIGYETTYAIQSGCPEQTRRSSTRTPNPRRPPGYREYCL